MRRKLTWSWIAAVGMGCAAARVQSAELPTLQSPAEKFSYGMGVDMARSFKRQGIEIDPDLVLKGLQDGLSGGRLLITEKELRKTQSEFLAEVRRKQAQNQRSAAEVNKAAGETFLAENKTKDGVVMLPSGLQYKILESGTGAKPMDDDSVECRYRGTLLDGTEFDSTDPGQTATMKVKAGPGVIPGLSEALKLMPVGSKWQLFIPPRLAYGQQGAGRDVGPNATLIFEMELVGIK